MTTLDGPGATARLGRRADECLAPGGEVTDYKYDADGNRISVTDNGVTTPSTANAMDQYASIGGVTYTYNSDGNLIEHTGPGIITAYTYDVRGRLIGVTTPTDTWSFEYDALGDRIGQIHNGVATNDLVDAAGDVVARYDASGTLIADFTQGVGVTSRIDSSGQADYYAFNAQGNTAQLTSPAGGLLDGYSYLPFGEPLATSGSVANPFTFGGEFGSSEEGDGLIAMGRRVVQPRAGTICRGGSLRPAGREERLCLRGQ